MEEKLLELAINSILHGSVQTVSETDMNGNVMYREVRINDLRTPLVEKLASKLVQTQEYKDLLDKVFTPEVIKKIQDKAIDNMQFSDIPYSIRDRIEREMKDMKVDVKKYKLVAETVEE